MCFALAIPTDIESYVHRNFDQSEVVGALRMLTDASLHDGSSPDARMLRCALAASDNSLKSLEYHVAGLAIDLRDVIVAGEYVHESGELVRVRDLSKPFVFDAA